MNEVDRTVIQTIIRTEKLAAWLAKMDGPLKCTCRLYQKKRAAAQQT